MAETACSEAASIRVSFGQRRPHNVQVEENQMSDADEGDGSCPCLFPEPAKAGFGFGVEQLVEQLLRIQQFSTASFFVHAKVARSQSLSVSSAPCAAITGIASARMKTSRVVFYAWCRGRMLKRRGRDAKSQGGKCKTAGHKMPRRSQKMLNYVFIKSKIHQTIFSTFFCPSALPRLSWLFLGFARASSHVSHGHIPQIPFLKNQRS